MLLKLSQPQIEAALFPDLTSIQTQFLLVLCYNKNDKSSEKNYQWPAFTKSRRIPNCIDCNKLSPSASSPHPSLFASTRIIKCLSSQKSETDRLKVHSKSAYSVVYRSSIIDSAQNKPANPSFLQKQRHTLNISTFTDKCTRSVIKILPLLGLQSLCYTSLLQEANMSVTKTWFIKSVQTTSAPFSKTVYKKISASADSTGAALKLCYFIILLMAKSATEWDQMVSHISYLCHFQRLCTNLYWLMEPAPNRSSRPY